MKNKMLKIGDKLPAFKLQNQEGEFVSDKDFKNKKVLVYFYPKDDTPGCTMEACGFRDFIKDFEKRGMVVVGISKDSVKSHKKFAEKFKLNFDLLSDETTETIQKFGAWGEKSMYGKKYMGINRISYLFNEQGKVEKVYGKVSTKEHEHAKEVLEN
jgi:peroxiredoxin Q/BCP